MARTALTHKDNTVGWICALEVEQSAARASLKKEHPRLSSIPGDPNRYRFGFIASHNIVVACQPDGEAGNNSAASAATRMTINLPSLKFGSMVESEVGYCNLPTVSISDCPPNHLSELQAFLLGPECSCQQYTCNGNSTSFGHCQHPWDIGMANTSNNMASILPRHMLQSSPFY